MTTSSPLLKTTLSLILLQLISRLFSFSLNQFLLRSTTPEALGIATMGLEILRDTGLFLLREGIRGAVIRSRNNHKSKSNDSSSLLISQTLLLPSLLSPLLPFLFLLYSFYPPSPLPTYFNLTLSLYSISVILELIAERYYLETLLNWEELTSLRVKIEGFAVGFKALSTLLCVILLGDKGALVAFGVGQVVYSGVLLVGLKLFIGGKISGNVWTLKKISIGTIIKGTEEKSEVKKVLVEVEDEKKVFEELYFDPELKQLSWALTKQSLVKQFLTEGDKIIIGRFSKVEDQGGYAIALNYGSLIARLLFQPLEETSRLYFSASLSQPTPSALLSTSTLLSSLLLLHTHLSLIFLFLAPHFTTPLLYHLLGTRWSNSSAGIILKTYCSYLPFLAINGITEAFFQSVADEKWLKRGSLWMGLCSLGFILFVVLGMLKGRGGKGGMGEIELIWANCFNMGLRILFSFTFIYSYYSQQIQLLKIEGKEEEEIKKNLNWRNWTPKFGTLVIFGLVWYLVKWSEKRNEWKSFRGLLQHLGIGAMGGLICVAVIYLSEREALIRLKNFIRPKKE